MLYAFKAGLLYSNQECMQRRVAGVVQNDRVRGRCGYRCRADVAAAVDDGHGVLFSAAATLRRLASGACRTTWVFCGGVAALAAAATQ